jgi:predicted regulator of Ras-like GTPase activity (Roadblock/LC7/MglB family)
MPPKITGTKVFHGPFALHLFDLLRQIRGTEQNLTLEVEFRGYEVGMVYFEGGRLVHAEFRDKIGEEAFLAMLAERDGKYKKIRELSADVISIERDATSLIAEYKERETEEIEETEPVLEAEVESQTANWTPPPAPERGLQEEAWLKDWGEGTPGFRSAWIVREDGTKITGVSEFQNDEISLAVGDILSGAKRLLDTPELEKLRITTAGSLCLIAALRERYFVVVEIEKTSTNPLVIEHRLARLVEALNQFLKQA